MPRSPCRKKHDRRCDANTPQLRPLRCIQKPTAKSVEAVANVVESPLDLLGKLPHAVGVNRVDWAVLLAVVFERGRRGAVNQVRLPPVVLHGGCNDQQGSICPRIQGRLQQHLHKRLVWSLLLERNQHQVAEGSPGDQVLFVLRQSSQRIPSTNLGDLKEVVVPGHLACGLRVRPWRLLNLSGVDVPVASALLRKVSRKSQPQSRINEVQLCRLNDGRPRSRLARRPIASFGHGVATPTQWNSRQNRRTPEGHLVGGN